MYRDPRFSCVESNPAAPAVPGPEAVPQAGRAWVRIPVREEADVAIARICVRRLAADGGLSESRTHSLATAVSEIARNIVVHGRAGDLAVAVAGAGDRRGLVVVARDSGPGIPDLEMAMQDGYSTAGRLGLGLSSARRLVDEFDVESSIDNGTTVTLRMWER